MPLLLFAGFLGSGKTTLILALARRAAVSGSRVCVLVNEVGEVGIDGEVLRVGDLEVRELTSGCICCQIGPDLVLALRELEERFRPHLVIVEASGIATPTGVWEALKYYKSKTRTTAQTVTLLDAARFAQLHEVVTPLIEAQVSGADRVVVTKNDEATTAEVGEAIAAAHLLAPTAPVYSVDATNEDSLAPLLADLLSAERT